MLLDSLLALLPVRDRAGDAVPNYPSVFFLGLPLGRFGPMNFGGPLSLDKLLTSSEISPYLGTSSSMEDSDS